jgi:hypothetical protein
MRVRRERPLHPVARQEALAPGNLFQDSRGKVLAFEQQAEMCFIESGMVQQREQNVLSNFVQKQRDLLGGRFPYRLGIQFAHSPVFVHAHASSLRRSQPEGILSVSQRQKIADAVLL